MLPSAFKIYIVLLTGLFFSSIRELSAVEPATNQEESGYTAIISYNDEFIASKSDGAVDWISSSGSVTKSEKVSEGALNDLDAFENTLVVAGDEGCIYVSQMNEAFKKMDSGTKANILSLTHFNEKIIAGTGHGELLSQDDNGLFQSIPLKLKGNIVSFSSRSNSCYGVTDEGEIIASSDGSKWTIFDFNAYYDGFYQACRFTKVLLTDNQIAVTGRHDDNTPVLLFSSGGSVWTERPLETSDDQGVSVLTEIPNDLFYDLEENQYVLACNNGTIMTIPSCSHCNKLYVISANDLKGISGNEHTLMIVGETDFIEASKIDY